MPCNVWHRTGSHYFLSAAPRSNHSGGVNVAFVDGHIGFLPDTVDEFAMAYLISVNDGPQSGLTFLDNDLGRIDLVEWGLIGGDASGSSGSLQVDQFFSFDD